MKIAFIIGTRPEIIKMSPLIDEVSQRGMDYVLIHTGQHYDHEMSQQFFLDLGLEKPHYNIGVGSGAHGKQTSMMMNCIEEVILKEKPDIVLVEGDTNAVLAGALVAAKLHIPVGHVEAGLRSYDKTMPEEINRMVADVCTQLFFVPTNTAAINLLFEGVNPKNIFITGNTIVDACQRNLKIARKQKNLKKLVNPGERILEKVLTLTLHRAENVDHPQRLGQIVNSLLELEDLSIIFPVHPRTFKNLQEFGLYDKLKKASHIQMIKPMGYLEFLLLLSESQLVLTDSGGIQEEAITLNVPCITLRYNTERPETVEAGGNMLVGTSQEKIVNSIRNLMNDASLYRTMKEAPNPYGDGTASAKILDIISELESRGGLKIQAPDLITGVNTTKLVNVDHDITVSELEEKYSAIVKIVFADEEAQYPEPELNLKDKMVLISGYGI